MTAAKSLADLAARVDELEAQLTRLRDTLRALNVEDGDGDA